MTAGYIDGNAMPGFLAAFAGAINDGLAAQRGTLAGIPPEGSA